MATGSEVTEQIVRRGTELPPAFFELVRRETGNRQYYRPVHSVHKWWARRPGSLFRGLLLSAFLPSQERVWDRYFTSINIPRETGTDPLVLDPFMGGGTTLIEAVRLGIRSVGVDLNAVAWWTVRQELQSAELEELRRGFEQVENACAAELQALYRTECRCGRKAEGVYFFWVKRIACSCCGEPVLLHKNYRLASAHRDNREVLHCPECGAVFSAPNGGGKTTCCRCGHCFDPLTGQARRAHYTCGACGHRGRIIDALEGAVRPPEHKLFAIEYYCPRHGRGYKQAESADIGRVEECERKLRESYQTRFVPDSPVPDGYNASQMQRYGYRRFSDLFNPRQQLALDKLARAVDGLEGGPTRELLVTLFSDILDYNCMFCGYNARNRQITNMFSHHAYIPQKEPVENNVWGSEAFGGGTFSAYFRKLVSAKRYNHQVFEKRPRRDGKLEEVSIPGERIDASLVDSVGGLQRSQEQAGAYPVPALLLNRSAEQLPLAAASVDAVVTDPPYFDNVMYSELAEFYYVWLRQFLAGDYCQFEPAYGDRAREAVTDPAGPRRAAHYREVLQSVFTECRRVLKPGAPMICTFHHGAAEAWITLASAVLAAGFGLVEFFSAQAEMDSSVHIRDRDSLTRDIVLIWKKWPVGLPELTAEEALAGDGGAGEKELADTPQAALAFLGKLREACTRAEKLQGEAKAEAHGKDSVEDWSALEERLRCLWARV